MSFTPRQWEARAALKNRRLRAKFPLLDRMGALESQLVTGEQLADRNKRARRATDEKFARVRAYFQALSDRYRSALAEHISEDDLTALDEHRTIFPPSPVYGADFFHRQLRDRGLPIPAAPEGSAHG